MSRSYKKTPYCGQSKGKKKKRIANHKVRQQLKRNYHGLSKSHFRKITNTWDICDFYWITTWEEFKERYGEDKKAYQYWLRHYKRK